MQFALCAPPFQWIPWLTFAALTVTLGSCWALAPAGIEVDEGLLLIRRRAWQPVTIALPDITSIECNQEDVLSGGCPSS